MPLGLLFVLGLLASSAQAGPTANLQTLAASELPELERVLTEAGWTMTPERSATYEPLDIYSWRANAPVAFGSKCFDAKPRERSYTSLEVVQALKVGGKVPLGIARIKGELAEYKQLTFAEPYISEVDDMALNLKEGCVDWLLKTQPDLSDLYVIQAVLSAEVKEQLCRTMDAGVGIAGFGAKAGIETDCSQASEGHVGVAYKTVPLSRLLERVGVSIGMGPGAAAPQTILEDHEGGSVSLSGQKHVVEFTTSPPGAVIIIDGKMLCQSTPCSKQLTEGAHFLVIEKERYQQYRDQIEVQGPKPVRRDLSPTFGLLRVTAGGQSLPFTVNGKAYGKSDGPPIELEPGRVSVKLDSDCYLNDRHELEIRRGETGRVDLQPRRRTALLDMTATDGRDNDLRTELFIDRSSVGFTPLQVRAPVCTRELKLIYKNRTARVVSPSFPAGGPLYLEGLFPRTGVARIQEASAQRFQRALQAVDLEVAEGRCIVAIKKAEVLIQRHADRPEPWHRLGSGRRCAEDWVGAFLAFHAAKDRGGDGPNLSAMMSSVRRKLVVLEVHLRSAPGAPAFRKESIRVRMVGTSGVEPLGTAPAIRWVDTQQGRMAFQVHAVPGVGQRLHILPGAELGALFIPIVGAPGSQMTRRVDVQPKKRGRLVVDELSSGMSLALMDSSLETHKVEAKKIVRPNQGSASLVARYRGAEKHIGLEIGAEEVHPEIPWAYEIFSGDTLVREELVEPDRESVSVEFSLTLANRVGSVPVHGVVEGRPGEVVRVALDPRKHPAYAHAASVSRLRSKASQYWIVDWGLGGAGVGLASYGAWKLGRAGVLRAEAATIVDPGQISSYRSMIAQAQVESRNGWVGTGLGVTALAGSLVHHVWRTRTHRARLDARRRTYDRVRTEPIDLSALSR